MMVTYEALIMAQWGTGRSQGANFECNFQDLVFLRPTDHLGKHAVFGSELFDSLQSHFNQTISAVHFMNEISWESYSTTNSPFLSYAT